MLYIVASQIGIDWLCIHLADVSCINLCRSVVRHARLHQLLHFIVDSISQW